jgi:hypothetical protein
MRNSINYVKDQHNFEKPFLGHLAQTGFDEVGIICKREFENDKKLRKRKFGQGKIGFVEYPWKGDPFWQIRQAESITDEEKLQFSKNLRKKKFSLEKSLFLDKGNYSCLGKPRHGSAKPLRRREGNWKARNFKNSKKNFEGVRSMPQSPERQRRSQSAYGSSASKSRYNYCSRKPHIRRTRLRPKKYRKNDRFSRTEYKKTGHWMKPEILLDCDNRKITKKITREDLGKIFKGKKFGKRKLLKYCKFWV